jgi:hypothetical protein
MVQLTTERAALINNFLLLEGEVFTEKYRT